MKSYQHFNVLVDKIMIFLIVKIWLIKVKSSSLGFEHVTLNLTVYRIPDYFFDFKTELKKFMSYLDLWLNFFAIILATLQKKDDKNAKREDLTFLKWVNNSIIAKFCFE